MKKQAFCNFLIAGVSLTHFGMKLPSNFSSLTLDNSEVSDMTSWTLNCTVGGDDTSNVNIASFEALIYSAAQSTSGTGIPVSFMFGWLDDSGNVDTYLSYQGFTLQYSVSTSGQYMQYNLVGYASLAIQTQLPVLNIPALSGIVQPSAIVEALAHAVDATYYYDLDIDHNDAPTLVTHGNLTTSFNKYIAGSYTGQDDYDTFPGLLPLSKSYNASRDSAGLDTRKVLKLSTAINNITVSPLSSFFKSAFSDTTPQSASFSYWIDEPTMTSKGVIHYKSNAGLTGDYTSDILQFGTSNSNILQLQGSYDGVAYNMTDMNFSTLGFAVDGSGNTIVEDAQVVNSWSSSLADVFQSANIINDVNALASQFSGNFTVTIIGNPRQYSIAQPVSLIVLAGNTLSPISGVYNIVSVSHQISITYVTVLKLQRLMMSSANQVAANQGIIIRGSSAYPRSSYTKTSNVISSGKVDFGKIYPTFLDMKVG